MGLVTILVPHRTAVIHLTVFVIHFLSISLANWQLQAYRRYFAAFVRTTILSLISWLMSLMSSSCLRSAPTVACFAHASFSSNLSVISSSRLLAACSSTCRSSSWRHRQKWISWTYECALTRAFRLHIIRSQTKYLHSRAAVDNFRKTKARTDKCALTMTVFKHLQRVTLRQRYKWTNKKTNEETCPFVRFSLRPFVCLSVVSVRGVHPLRGMKYDASQKLKGGWVKIRDQPINTRNLVSWLSGKSLKLLP